MDDGDSPVEDLLPLIVLLPPKPSLVVLPFEVFTTDETLELTGLTVPMAMVSQLSREDTLSVTPFSFGQKLANSSMETAYTIGYKLRVRCVVTGSILPHDNRLIVNCEVVSSELRTIVHTFQREGSTEELPKLVEELNRELVRFVGSYEDPR